MTTSAATTLPHWETTPPDLKAAIRETKAAIRARIEASGRTVEEVFAVVEANVAERVTEIEEAKRRGETVWPVIDYADIAAGTVPAEARELLHRRGCAVVRGHFEREQALAWDKDIVDYVERNNFFEDYRGPCDAFHRTDGPQYPGSTMCSVFRTFQGWTALSDMAHDQGVLFTVPIPEAMAYLMLRPLLPDVPEDDMCGVTVNQVYPVNEKWHPLLVRGFAGIPDIQAGDSVWWHCDVVHGVAPVENQQGWGNVMYIPAAPWCPRNEKYAPSVRQAFLNGDSPSDFPEEHYERDWPDRFQPEQLNETGRRGLGMA